MLPMTRKVELDERAKRLQHSATAGCCCPVAAHGRAVIERSQWGWCIAAMAQLVAFFNAHTGRLELPHPGFVEIFAFCPRCGATLDGEARRTELNAALDNPGAALANRTAYLELLDQMSRPPTVASANPSVESHPPCPKP